MCTRTLIGHDQKSSRPCVYWAAFSPNSGSIVTASNDDTARIWNAKTGKKLVMLKGHASWVFSAMFSPDGNSVVTASLDNSARIWKAQSGECTLVICLSN